MVIKVLFFFASNSNFLSGDNNFGNDFGESSTDPFNEKPVEESVIISYYLQTK